MFGSNTHPVSAQQVGDGGTQWPMQPAMEITQSYDANGRTSKRTQIMRQNIYDPDTGQLAGVDESTLNSHYIHSSVLGAQVVELDATYGQNNVWVYAGGQRIARTTFGSVNFEHHNPATRLLPYDPRR